MSTLSRPRRMWERTIAKTRNVWRNVRHRKTIYASTLSSWIRSPPREPLHFDQMPKGYYCMRYARLAAEKLYGLHYAPAPAWRVRNVNHVVWNSKRSPEPLESILKPGHLLGIYNPASFKNRFWRPYTHVALYVGIRDGKPYILHRVGNEDLLEEMHTALAHRHWTIHEVLEPAD